MPLVLTYSFCFFALISSINVRNVAFRPKLISERLAFGNINYCLVILTFYLFISLYICKVRAIKNFSSQYLLLFFTTLLSLILFARHNLFLFFLIFELSIIPLMILIFLYGYQPERLLASTLLLIYALIGSLPFLLAIGILFNSYDSFSVYIISLNRINNFSPGWLLFSLIIPFLVKIPIYRVHAWLPKAHVEAPVSASILLGAVSLKIGGLGLYYSFLIINFSSFLLCTVISFSIVGGVIATRICLSQNDMKSLIAYRSVGHISLVLLGLGTGLSIGVFGAILIILAHGFICAGLFGIANFMYSITGSRRILVNKGLGSLRLIMIVSVAFIRFANRGNPPTLNLLREIVALISRMSYGLLITLCATLMSFISFCVRIYFFLVTQHGKLNLIVKPGKASPQSGSLLLRVRIPVYILPVYSLILF